MDLAARRAYFPRFSTEVLHVLSLWSKGKLFDFQRGVLAAISFVRHLAASVRLSPLRCIFRLSDELRNRGQRCSCRRDRHDSDFLWRCGVSPRVWYLCSYA